MARQWVQQLQKHIARNKKLSVAERAAKAEASNHSEDDHGHNILERPHGGGAAVVMYYVTLPILFALHYTVPDVRNSRFTKWYPVTMILSVAWLAFLAEFMMNSAESSGCIAGVSDDIMGLTVTAAGTSLPNLFASTIVAGQGLGNMAVSNAFGSNTFNIFIALALPWFIGALRNGIGNDTYSYHVEKGSIFLSCQILGLVLVGIVVCIASMNFRINRTLGWPFIVVYLIIMTFLCLR